MRKKYFMRSAAAFLFVFLFTLPAKAETASGKKSDEKKQKIEEATRKEQAEKEKELKRLREREEQVERLTKQQQFIEEHNRRLRDTIDRTQFGMGVLLLKKDAFEVNEKIDVDYVIKNGSKRTFLIDGRKFLPTYVVKDEKGNAVLTLQKTEKHSPPKKKDLTALAPGKIFELKHLEPFSLPKPGTYTLVGTYTLPQPAKENPDVWYGTIIVSRRLEIVEEKK